MKNKYRCYRNNSESIDALYADTGITILYLAALAELLILFNTVWFM